MVDGYTVEEAASVLGVPRERVWELIARGILSASTDLGGGMRVRLKAEPPPPAPVGPVERPPEAPPPAFDMNPFRELLTEFRSLTERYGQALLALGEARGEVAGLRSRVDMLEARVDVHPSAGPPISSSWDASPWPTPRERVDAPDEPVAPAEDQVEADASHEETEAAGDHAEDSTPHRRRGRRRATESFADALARAEDPSPPELPGAAETAAALAGLRQEAPPGADEARRDDAEALLPRELPSADEMPVDEIPVAEEELAEPDVAESWEPNEPEPPPAEDDTEPAPVEAEVEVEAMPPAPAAESEPEVEQPSAAAPQPLADDDDRGDAAEQDAAAAEEAPGTAPEPIALVEGEPRDWPRPDGDAEQRWDADHYSTDIEEPGWISADDVAVPPPAREQRPAPIAARTESEPGSLELSGSRELDEALAALDALAHPEPEPAAAVDPELREAEDRAAFPPDGHSEPPGPAPAWTRTTPPPQLVMRSPASRAYRRLKRIFPT